MKTNRHSTTFTALTAALLLAVAPHRASALELLAEDFDAGDGGFIQNAYGTSPVPAIYNPGAGTWSFPGDDSGPSSNTLTGPPTAMPVTGGLRIRFDHRWSAEAFWDGVLLQLSVNGGAFVNVPRAAFRQNGYTERLIGNHDIRGEDAFGHRSPGYSHGEFIASIAEFGAAAAGDSIRIRFAGGWDLNTIGEGVNWELDRVMIETLEDTDGDGMADAYEQLHHLDKASDDSALDPDADGLTNLEEFLRGTNPLHADTDDDGLDDAMETGTDPRIADLGVGIPGLLGRFDFNSGDGGFLIETGGLTPVVPTYNAGRGSWQFGADADGPSYAGLVSPPITMPATGGLRIYFRHRYKFEAFWDGSAVEYSINGGSYRRVTMADFSRNGYNSGILVGDGELFDDAAFTRESEGYASGQFITSVAEVGIARRDDVIRFRFLAAWDDATVEQSPNWEVDEVAVQLLRDTDGDGIADHFEFARGLDETVDDAGLDLDGDGLSNFEEILGGTLVWNADSDGDGLSDGVESGSGVYTDATDTGTNPLLADSDGDGLADGIEDNSGTLFSSIRTGTDPNVRDMDGDRFDDGYEIQAGTDPRQAGNFPALAPDLEWDLDRQPEGLLRAWPAVLNRINNRSPLFAFGKFGYVEAGTTNFRNVRRWVHVPAFDFRSNPGGSWETVFGNAITQTNASWEMVVRPGDYIGQHILFNTGGNGAGVALFLLGNILEFRFQSADSDSNRVVVSTDLSLLGPPTDFYHIVAVSDVTSSFGGTGWLYVNGTLVAGPVTSASTISDWSGSDSAELGLGNSVPGSGAFPFDFFTGDIAAFGFYSGSVLEADSIMSRYENYAGVPFRFQISGITVDPFNASVTLTWNSQPGRSYAIDLSPELGEGAWGEITDSVAAAVNSVQTSFTHVFPNGEVPPRMFYRVREEP